MPNYKLKKNRPALLQSILDEKTDNYKAQRAWIFKAWEVKETLEEMIEPLKFYPGSKVEIFLGHWNQYISANYIQINCYNIPYDIVIEEFAGPVHRKYDCFWDLWSLSIFELTGKPNGIRTDIKIDEGEKTTCKVIKIPIKPTITENFKYALDCGEGLDLAQLAQ